MTLRSLLVLAGLLFATTSIAADKSPTPSADYSPQQVVSIVIDALKYNDADKGDQGISTVFRFASPANKVHTGPIDRFTTMIKRGFPEMLNHKDSEVGDMEIQGDKALQVVWLTTPGGAEVGYLFQLGKQSGGDYDGMWMTDAVYPQPERGQSI